MTARSTPFTQTARKRASAQNSSLTTVWSGARSFGRKRGSNDKENGVIFCRFTRCPNADMGTRHGLRHIMPAFCNCDYIGLADIGATLIRRDTLARGRECDYTIVGSDNPLVKEHPRTVDENGFWANE